MELILILTTLLTIIAVFVITEHQRRKIEERIQEVELEVTFYGKRIVQDVDAIATNLSIMVGDNVERI